VPSQAGATKLMIYSLRKTESHNSSSSFLRVFILQP
jgi:hypothetical protein